MAPYPHLGDIAVISLRHHAISLAAVFLALAVGIVLGSGVLSDTLLSGLRTEKQDLQKQITVLTDQRNALNEKLGAASEFDTQMAGRMVRDALSKKSVVIFRTPDADNGDVDALARVVGDAGGTITGTVSLTQEFVEANSAEKLRSVVNSSVVPAGAQLSTTLVDQGSQAGDLLGVALLINRNPAVKPADDAQRDTVLASLRDTGFVTYQGDRLGASDAAIVVTGTMRATRGRLWRDSRPRWCHTVRALSSWVGTVRRRERRRWRSRGRTPEWRRRCLPSMTSAPSRAGSPRPSPSRT